jgi:uncharacterized membrane protein
MEPTFDAWIKLLAQLPFAIVVAAYLLFRFDRLITQLVENESKELLILEEMRETIAKLVK